MAAHPTTDDASKEFQKFLDGHQYTRAGILRYEKIFGEGFVSTGGMYTTKPFVEKIGIKAGETVLDVGCGIGGGDFYMAKDFGADVLGIDLSQNMLAIAHERAAAPENAALSVKFQEQDVTTADFPPASFDVIYSRDTLLHIADKPALFVKFFEWLRPGGRILISDYCRGEPLADAEKQAEFNAYVASRGYTLLTVENYGKALEAAGLTSVVATNVTPLFVECLVAEAAKLEAVKDSFVAEFSLADFDYLMDGWRAKMVRCEAGLQTWGLFEAVKAPVA